jgi:hypothetical protein
MATKKKAKTAKAAPARKAAKKRAAAKKTAKRAAAKKTAKRATAKPAAKKRATAKRAPAKKRATAKRAPAKKRASAAKPAAAEKATARTAPPAEAHEMGVRRRDRPGHIDPRYARELRARGSGGEADPLGFVDRPRSHDDLVEELAEEFVESATSAEPVAQDVANQDVPEELGGPFVVTTAKQEMAHGTDPSNPQHASREPFPRT